MNRRAETRRRLLARIHRNYQTRTESLAVGAVRLEFTRIADPNRVLDEVARAEDLRLRLARPDRAEPLGLPYWAELWDSALGVGQFLQRSGSGPLSVLDLGCGLGLAGAVAAALGHRVTMADLEPPALLFARLNSLAWSDRVIVRKLDWRRDRLGRSFELILGSDILYDKTQWEFLERFWSAHLADGGRILLGEPGRQTGPMFVDWIGRKDGWEIQRFEEPVSTRPQPIRVLELRKK